MNNLTKSELAFAFSQMHEQHLEMLPKELLQDVSENFDASLIKHLDPEKPFSEQDLSEETLEVLASLFKDKFN